MRLRVSQCLLAFGVVVEELDESFVLMENRLRPVFPQLDLAYVHQNVNRGRAADCEERVQRGLAQLSANTARRLQTANEADLELYAWAVERMVDARARQPDLQQSLNLFRERCAALRVRETA